jgi:hypothetical protein
VQQIAILFDRLVVDGKNTRWNGLLNRRVSWRSAVEDFLQEERYALGTRSPTILETPVISPPGCARFATKPVASGAFKDTPTIGTVRERP